MGGRMGGWRKKSRNIAIVYWLFYWRQRGGNFLPQVKYFSKFLLGEQKFSAHFLLGSQQRLQSIHGFQYSQRVKELFFVFFPAQTAQWWEVAFYHLTQPLWKVCYVPSPAGKHGGEHQQSPSFQVGNVSVQKFLTFPTRAFNILYLWNSFGTTSTILSRSFCIPTFFFPSLVLPLLDYSSLAKISHALHGQCFLQRGFVLHDPCDAWLPSFLGDAPLACTEAGCTDAGARRSVEAGVLSGPCVSPTSIKSLFFLRPLRLYRLDNFFIDTGWTALWNISIFFCKKRGLGGSNYWASKL